MKRLHKLSASPTLAGVLSLSTPVGGKDPTRPSTLADVVPCSLP